MMDQIIDPMCDRNQRLDLRGMLVTAPGFCQLGAKDGVAVSAAGSSR